MSVPSLQREGELGLRKNGLGGEDKVGVELRLPGLRAGFCPHLCPDPGLGL